MLSLRHSLLREKRRAQASVLSGVGQKRSYWQETEKNLLVTQGENQASVVISQNSKEDAVLKRREESVLLRL